jgi:transposase
MTRRRFTSEEKVALLRDHVEKNISVPDICEKHQIHPNQFYRWRKELFEKAVNLFSLKGSDSKRTAKRIAQLEDSLKDRNEVIAELLQENLKLKKANGKI